MRWQIIDDTDLRCTNAAQLRLPGRERQLPSDRAHELRRRVAEEVMPGTRAVRAGAATLRQPQ